MAKVAFAWELGANYGHLARTLPIAEFLRADGHDVLFVTPNLVTAHSLLTPLGLPFVAAPHFARGPPRHSSPANYGQILADYGYSDRNALRACVEAWINLWRTIEADVIVIDHAPTALLAARILRTPRLQLSIGFAVPPDMEPLPSLRPWEAIPTETLRQSDAAVLENINAVLSDFKHAPLPRLADLFAGVPALLTTFAELDPFGARTSAKYIGPTDAPDNHPSAQWLSGDRPHVFAYLRADMRSFEPLLAALREFPAETICVIPDASAALLARLRASPIRLFTNSLNLPSLLPGADVVVGYGSTGLIAQAASAGVPMLAAPHTVEHYLSAQRLAALGAAIVMDAHPSVADIRNALQELVSEPRYRQAAKRFAQRYASFDPVVASKEAAAIVARLGSSGEHEPQDCVAPGAPPTTPAPAVGRRVLYAWELGANAGHLERGLTVAELLRQQHYDVAFAVRDLNLAQRLLASKNFSYLSCPVMPPRPPRRATVNYSDLLLECGFDDAAALSARLRAWIEMYRQLRADVVLIDHSPTAQLAAYICDLPSVLIGSGFSIPPNANPLPSIQPRRQISAPQLVAADQQLLKHVNQVLREFARPALSQVSELFARSPQIITTFAELDPYAARAGGEHVGPIDRTTSYTRVEWVTIGSLRVFAYLRPFVKGIESLLQALQACQAEVKCVLPGAPASFIDNYRSPRLEIFASPVEPAALLREADVVVSYGSAGMIAQSLLAGVPLLLLCDALEHITNSMRVVELGAGIAVVENRNREVLREALVALSSDGKYRDAARKFAQKYRDRGEKAGGRIVEAIETLMNGRGGSRRKDHPLNS